MPKLHLEPDHEHRQGSPPRGTCLNNLNNNKVTFRTSRGQKLKKNVKKNMAHVW